MNKPHKHTALIKAWADGAEIEIKRTHGGWDMVERPAWGTADEYRIKPEPTYKTQPGDLVIGTQASGNEVMGTFTVAGGTYYVNNLVGVYTCSSCKLHPKQLLIYKQADQIAEFRQQMKKMYKGTWCGD